MRSTARRARIFEIPEAFVDCLKTDAFHVRAQIARSHEFHVRRFIGDVGRHRALGDEQRFAWLVRLHPVDHARRRAREVGNADNVRRALWMRNDFHTRIGVPVGFQFAGGEPLVNLAVAAPCAPRLSTTLTAFADVQVMSHSAFTAAEVLTYVTIGTPG